MDLNQTHFSLIERIRLESHRSREAYQVVKRMKKLLPESIQSLKLTHKSGNSSSKAERLAKIDPEYLNLLGEYLAVFHRGLESRIQWETHNMLLSARQTIRKLAES